MAPHASSILLPLAKAALAALLIAAPLAAIGTGAAGTRIAAPSAERYAPGHFLFAGTGAADR